VTVKRASEALYPAIEPHWRDYLHVDGHHPARRRAADRRHASDPLLAFADPDFVRRSATPSKPAAKRGARGFASYFRDERRRLLSNPRLWRRLTCTR
jgi:hypothetical protein